MIIPNHSFRSATTRYLLAGLLATAVGFAQNPGWRRADEPAPSTSASDDPSTPVAQPPADNQPQFDPQNGPSYPQNGPSYGAIPPRLTIPSGKFLTVRMNQPISTDHNQVGDFFTATLAEPVVVDGVVVAQQGQTVNGRVTLVEKGGRVSGVSKLGVQLTQFTAVDGQQLPIQTQFIGRNARTTNGRDVAAVATTTGVGAAIGAAADWGRGAAIGAGAGAAVGLVGVLLTRGAPAIIYPESLLSFRVETPVTVSTERAPQAFRYVDPNEYRQQPVLQTRMNGGPPAPYGPYPYAPYPYAYPYPYPYAYGYGPYWGPSFGIVIGPRWGYYGYRGGGYYRFRR
jgi:hypothetical protein